MNIKKTLLSVAISGAIMSTAFGAGFQIFEQSATLMGQANSGTGVTTDPSIQYYNPAGMAFIKDTEVGISGIVLRTRGDLRAIQATGIDGRNIIPGSTQAAPNFQTTIPSLFVVRPVNPKLRFGIGVESSFGLKAPYQDNSVTRYFALTSKLTTVSLNPSFSYLIHPDFSIGAGLVAQYAKADLDQAVDGTGAFNANVPPPARRFFPAPGDIYVKNRADGTALGWDVGAEYKNDKGAIGLSYHSHINQTLTGTTRVSGNQFSQQFLAMGGVIIANGSAYTTLKEPGFLTLSGERNLTNKWHVMADVEYIFWHRLQQATLRFSTPGQMPQVINFNYRNTWRIALGQSYQIEPDLLLRMGVAWDKTPTPNDYVRSARLPDNNRFWLAVGGTYDIDKHADISFGYAHVFIRSNTVNSTNPTTPTETFIGRYSGGGADLVGAQLNVRFA